MRPSRWLATAAFLFLVPAAIVLAFAGHDRGLYPYAAVPFAFGAAVVVLLGAVFAALHGLRRFEG